MPNDSAQLRAPAGSWVTDEFGIALVDKGLGDGGSPVGLTMGELIEVGLRRNPRRAQLLVSTVLGKHLPADPRVVAGTGRLLGALVARTLVAGTPAGDPGPAPAAWIAAAKQTVSGADAGALIEVLDRELLGGVSPAGVLTVGFAETATAVGHFVADQLGSGYLHSTRRRDGAVPVAAEFSEPHSHATGHLLRPEPPTLLDGSGPVVLVDDELSTGRTALNVIEELQVIAPRDRYVLAGLVDVRSADDDRNRAAVAERLGCRIDVVSLVRGQIIVPTGIVDRVSTEVFAHQVVSVLPNTPGAVWRVELPWPAEVPSGGRHGFVPADRPHFDAAVGVAGQLLSTECGQLLSNDPGGRHRVLVLGTEELMYLPLRLALELARDPLHAVAFQSTTRSPVHAIDRTGYPVRRRIDFRSAVLGDDTRQGAIRHLYNAAWPPVVGQTHPAEADLIVIMDDGHALPGPTGIADTVAAATGTPVLLAVLSPPPRR